MQKRKGISLIVLVITIIVMVILAGAIVLTLNNSGIIGKASEAVDATNEAAIKELVQMAWAEAYTDGATTDKDFQAAVDKVLQNNKINTSGYTIKATTEGVVIEEKTIHDEVQALAETKWQEAKAEGVTKEYLLVAVLYGLKQEGIDTTLYDIVVTEAGVTVELEVPADSQIQNLAEAGWEAAYISGSRTQAELESYVYKHLTNEGIDTTLYDISVTTTGVKVEEK